MKYQTLNLVASTPLIVGFAPSASTIWQHRINAINCQNVIHPTYNGCIPFTSTRTTTDIRVSLPFFSQQFRTAALLARPKANLEEEGDDDSDFEDEDAEDEEEEDEFEEDIEIGIDDDGGAEDEEELEEEIEEITMEYAEDDEEEYEYYDEDEIQEESLDDYEYEDDGEGPDFDASELPEIPEVWATYDEKFEDPATPLLESDDSDPHYNQAKETTFSDVEKRNEIAEEEKKMPRTIQGVNDVKKLVNYFQNELTDKEKKEIASDPDVVEAEAMIKDGNMQITESDLKDFIVQDEEGNDILDEEAMGQDDVSFKDMHGYDAFPSISDTENGGDLMYPSNKAYTEKDLVEIDDLLQQYRDVRAKLDNQTFFGEDHTFAYMDVERDWPLLDNETQREMMEVMETSTTMACPEPELWLMYDNNFNVTNLILASFRHNQEAPIMFTQWMPQLHVYERYADQREKGFSWTWDDVEAADMDELERYYRGIGYNSIPTKQPHETGIIELDESEMDDDEREMLALENWYDEVYNEEEQNLLFDDENFEAKDNVFAPDYSPANDKTEALAEKFMKEHERFQKELHHETQEWRDQFATVEEFEVREDPEGQEVFRGHMVIACAPLEEDLELAEKITERFEKEFGKAVYVETRVLGHARKEDNVYEIWLESYDIDLLHSKRQAFINSKVWTGPSDVDDSQLNYLVDRVKELISDESRYSYRMDDIAGVKI